MSSIVEIKQKINDFEALRGAIENRLEGRLHEDVPTNVFGRTCQHHATFPNAYYKLGIQEKEGEFDLVYDSMLSQVGGRGAGKLLDAYNCEKTTLEAYAKGYSTHEFTEADGTQVIEVLITDY